MQGGRDREVEGGNIGGGEVGRIEGKGGRKHGG